MAILLGEWLFNNNLNDTSGYGHTPTLNNYTPVYVSTGPLPSVKGIHFNGTGQGVIYGRTGLEPDASYRGVTSMAWMRSAVTIVDSSAVLTKPRLGSSSNRAGFYLTSTQQFRPIARWKDDLHYADGTGPALNDGLWHHLTVVDSDTQWAWYIDGALIDSGGRSFDTSTSPTWDDYPWFSGANVTNGGDGVSYDGLEVAVPRIFGGGMTQSEVQTWMNTGAATNIELAWTI